MIFNSLHFLIFFPIVLLVYYAIPKKIKYLWLLVCSYYFYMSWNAQYALLILFSTAITYISGIGIDAVKKSGGREQGKRFLKKLIVAFSLILNLSVLFFFKYFDFAWENISSLLLNFGIVLNAPAFDVILPVGISFYTFQALSYTLDVYRGDIYAEKNFFRYALFVSFFPQLVAGPIERSKNLLRQLAVPQKANWERMRHGFLIMLWGYFIKVVLADRLSIYVDTVYGNYEQYPGMYLVLATILFAFQIYCDFAGYSTIAIGASEVLGIQLMENFNVPYLSRSTSEFWRRWHISLSSWFRDYLYIPLGGNRKGKLRKYLNLLITFSVSGLWHGASWSFIIWGFLNGLYQIVGDILKPVRIWILNLFHIDREQPGHKLMQTLMTFVLIDLTWVFFRANDVKDALAIIKSMFTMFNPWILIDQSIYGCGLDEKDFGILIFCLIILMVADIFKYHKVQVSYVIEQQALPIRWVIYIFSIIFILVFGIWGAGYDVAGFIYFQF